MKLLTTIARTCVLWLVSTALTAQNLDYTGAVNTALAHAKVFDDSPWAGTTNVANLASWQQPAIGAAYQLRFNMNELSTRAATVTWPTGFGVMSALVMQSGYSKSQYTRYALAYSRLFGKGVAAGLQFNYLSHHLEGSDKTQTFYSALGLTFQMHPRFDAGVFIQNPEKSQITYEDTAYDLATFFNVALRFRAASNLALISEIEKQLTYDPVYKGALQLSIQNQLMLRGGLKARPVELTFGAGFRWSKLQIDVGFSHHQQLGLSSGAGILYVFNTKHP